MHVVLKAPAKINLHLSVLGKRSDGYHDILSLMQMIDLCDRVSVGLGEEIPPDGGLPETDIPGPDNTVWLAYRIFSEHTGIRDPVWLRLEKTIPSGAGLGGGSSDAAAALRALDRLFRTGLSGNDLELLGVRIGMDVPFFLRSAAAIVQGRGEIITDLSPRMDFRVLVAFPGFSVSTAKAYRMFDETVPYRTGHPADADASEIAALYEKCAVEAWKFSNSFEKILPGIYPKGTKICKLLRGLGASHASLTGSGSAIIGIFADSENAEAAASELKEQLPWVVISAPLEMKPAPVVQ